jgi:PAS domain S-box-containing protein
MAETVSQLAAEFIFDPRLITQYNDFMERPPDLDSTALRLLLSTVLDAAVAIDAEGKVVGWNLAAERTFGWSQAEARGQSLSDLIVPSKHKQAHAEGMHRYQQTGEAHVVNRRIEIDARAKSGREFPIELSITEAHDGSGAAFVGFMRDISERIAMEQRLRETQKLEAVGHLTGGIAHDFNNLLTVILGSAEILAESVTDPELKKLAEVTLLSAERGAELTNRLLAFARRQPLNPKPTNVNQLVGAMQGIVRRTLPVSIDVEFNSDPDLGLIEIDAGELDSALLNLVVNARDAMQGEGKLVIETANTKLGTEYALRHPEVVPGEYIMLSVTDTGTGMDALTAERVFEPFFTTKPVGEGSGLGLSMVFGFTKQSGGHIEICSELGVGTEIKLYFPRLTIA